MSKTNAPSEAIVAQIKLRAAWDEVIGLLGEARDAIDQPQLMPAPASDRNLAEGYRYLMGFVHNAIERSFHQDPVRPHFRNALSIITRSTIDNPDAIYFSTPIDGRKTYRLRGEIGDARHWKGEVERACFSLISALSRSPTMRCGSCWRLTAVAMISS